MGALAVLKQVPVLQDKDAHAGRGANQSSLLSKGLLDALMALSLAEGGVSSQPVRCQVQGSH